MGLNFTDTEIITDTSGKVVSADVATFLKSIDRLLTVGAYYDQEHDQYRRASETLCASMVEAIRPRTKLTVEIAATALVIDGHVIDPRHRAVRQFHDLLVALNLACVEVSARLTAADLRQALAALQAQRLESGQSQSFHALDIGNLPPTVSVTSRRVTSRGDGGAPSLDALLDAWSEQPAPLNFQTDQVVRTEFVQELMAMLQQAADNLDADTASSALDADQENRRQVISREELQAIQEGVQRLLDRDPGASEIANLMKLARQVLDVSGDPDKARLVFEKLRKDLVEDDGAPLAAAAAEAPVEWAGWPVDEIVRRVAELAAREEPVPEPGAGTRRDELAIGFRMLDAGPREPGFDAALEILRRSCRAPELGRGETGVITAAIGELAAGERREVADLALPHLLGDLRAARPELLAGIWSELAGKLGPRALATVWPHLVNDLLLGLEPASESQVVRCCLLAGELEFEAALAQLPRLERLPGAARPQPSDQVFLVPPTRARGVHAAILHTAAADRHLPRLFRELVRRPPDALTGIVTRACASCGPGDRRLVLALLRDSGRDAPSPAMTELAASLLLETVATLEPSRREEAWTAEAITWLGGAVPARAQPLLQRIVEERRWRVRPVWPEACRVAAAAALAARIGED